MPVGQAVTATRRLGPLAFAAPAPAPSPPAAVTPAAAAGAAAGEAASVARGRGVGGRLVRQGGLDELDDLRLGGRGAQAGREVLFDQ